MGSCVQNIGERSAQNRMSGRIAIIGLAVSMMLGSLGVSLPYVALPAMTEEYGVSLQAVQWVVTAYLLSVTTLVVGAGRLGDIFGSRNVLLAGLALFTVASLVCAAAPTFSVLIVGRAVQGAGAAALMALTLVVARQTAAQHEIGSVMGLLGTMSAIGTALGPALGGALTVELGWRAIFLALAPFGVVGLVVTFVSVPSAVATTQRSIESFDTLGTLLLGLTVGLYALALSGAGSGWSNLGWVLITLVVVAAFVLVELRAEAPLVHFPMLRDGDLVTGLASNMLTATVMMATLVVGPFFLAGGLGLDVTAVGLVVSIGPLVAACSGIPSGRIVDRFGARAVVAGGLIQVFAGCIALALLPRSWGVTGYVAAIAVLTSGYQLFLAANNTAVMVNARDDWRGVISGLLTLSRNLGLSTGASLMGGMFASMVHGTGLGNPDAVTRAMNMTFAFAGALVLVALIAALTTRPWLK